MDSIGILNFHWMFPTDTLRLKVYEYLHPEVHANYIDRDRYVDTNYVSSGGRDRMK